VDQRTEPSTHVVEPSHNGHARLTRVVCVSCGAVGLVAGTPVPGHLCAVCEAEQE
jgi:hypothetical protein